MNVSLDVLVPALAGYLFLRTWNPSRFGLMTESGYHVLFYSALVGLLLYVAGLGLEEWPPLPGWASTVFSWVEGGLSTRRATVWSLLLGVGLPQITNRFYSSEKGNRRAARKRGQFVASVLDDAMRMGRHVEVSLRDGKTYVGLVMRNPGVDEEAVLLVPLLSGYRRPVDKRLVLTSNYARLLNARYAREWEEDLGVAIPQSNVMWARPFDLSLYSVPEGEQPPQMLVDQDS